MADPEPGPVTTRYRLSAALQLALAAIFVCDAFSYTVIDPYLPAAFPTASSLAVSMLFGMFPIAQLLGSLVLLLVQLVPGAAAMQAHHDAFVTSAAFLGFTLATIPSVVFPDSLAAMFVQRALT